MHSNCGQWQNLRVFTALSRTSLRELVYSAQQVTGIYGCRALPLPMVLVFWHVQKALAFASHCRSVIRTNVGTLYQFDSIIYRVSQEERAKLQEGVPYVKIYWYNPKHLYPKWNSYGDNGQRSLKLWQLLHTYWLPNSYWNWQEYVFSVTLISVLNIKLTCEWHKAIKLNYKNTRTHVIVVLSVTKPFTQAAADA